jgi:decaprenylphospho-beta-D-erythro-pentofuranosid-2-ulose 2-reductase
MTAGLAEAPLAVEAGEVADAITAALTGPSRTIWVPRAMRPVMSVLRHLPRPVFRRLPI